MSKKPLSEESMLALEQQIPLLASGAVAQAKVRALAAGQKVLVVRDGWLVEESADGSVRRLRQIPAGHKVTPGTHRRLI